jgi:hypothetical protein
MGTAVGGSVAMACVAVGAAAGAAQAENRKVNNEIKTVDKRARLFFIFFSPLYLVE